MKLVKNIRVYTAESKIHLIGLFSAHDIEAGSIIGCFHSSPPSNKQILEDGPYLIHFDEEDKRYMTCGFRYINHSENPNVILYDDSTVVALRDIREGEELTSEYGQEWVDQQRLLGIPVY